MIRFLVDFALKNRMLVLALGRGPGDLGHHFVPQPSRRSLSRRSRQVCLGDYAVAGRAAEEVEQQVTIPIETQMNGLGT